MNNLDKIYERNSFDVIVTNPPYKKENTGIVNEEKKKLISRHEILAKLEDKKYAFFEIPMGLIYSSPLISHIGPTIPGKMCLIGDVIASSYYSIDPFGINSCLITLYVKVKLNIATYLPLIYESEEVEVDVPLSMNVIEGKIPSTIIGSYSI